MDTHSAVYEDRESSSSPPFTWVSSLTQGLGFFCTPVHPDLSRSHPGPQQVIIVRTPSCSLNSDTFPLMVIWKYYHPAHLTVTHTCLWILKVCVISRILSQSMNFILTSLHEHLQKYQREFCSDLDGLWSIWVWNIVFPLVIINETSQGGLQASCTSPFDKSVDDQVITSPNFS